MSATTANKKIVVASSKAKAPAAPLAGSAPTKKARVDESATKPTVSSSQKAVTKPKTDDVARVADVDSADASTDEEVPFIIPFNLDLITKHLPYWDIEFPKKGDMQNTCRLIDTRTRKEGKDGPTYRSIPMLQKGSRPKYDATGKEIVAGTYVYSNGPLEPFDSSAKRKTKDGQPKKQTQGNYYELREKDAEFIARKKAHLTPGHPRRKQRYDVEGDDLVIWQAIQAHFDKLVSKHYETWDADEHLFYIERPDADVVEMMVEKGRLKNARSISDAEILNCRTARANSYSSPVLKSYDGTDFKTKATVQKYSVETKVNVEKYKEVPPCLIKVSPLVPFPKDPTKTVRGRMAENESVSYTELPFDKREPYIVTWSIPNLGGKNQEWRANIMTEYLDWHPRPPSNFVRQRNLGEDKDQEDIVPSVSASDWKRLKTEAEANQQNQEADGEHEQEGQDAQNNDTPQDQDPPAPQDESYDSNQF